MTESGALGERVSEIWRKFQPAILARVAVLEEMAVALVSGERDVQRRRVAEREAHKLAGSVGTFGFAAASGHARAIELPGG